MPTTVDADCEKNGRVTTREFYEMQLKIRDDMNNGFATVEKEISELKVETVSMTSKLEEACKMVDRNTDEITSIKRRSNALDAGVLIISGIWTGIVTLAAGNK